MHAFFPCFAYTVMLWSNNKLPMLKCMWLYLALHGNWWQDEVPLFQEAGILHLVSEAFLGLNCNCNGTDVEMLDSMRTFKDLCKTYILAFVLTNGHHAEPKNTSTIIFMANVGYDSLPLQIIANVYIFIYIYIYIYMQLILSFELFCLKGSLILCHFFARILH